MVVGEVRCEIIILKKKIFLLTLQLISPTTASYVVRFVPHLIVCLALSNQNQRCVYVLHCPVKTSVLFSLFSISISFQNAGSPLDSDNFDGLGVIPVLE